MTDWKVPIFSSPFLNPAECSQVISDVNSLKTLWLAHGSNPEFPYFYTLGAANYIYRLSPKDYLLKVREQIAILEPKFSYLYDKLLSALTYMLQGAIHRFAENVALPGFHIFPRNMPNGGLVHRDIQFKDDVWPEPDKLDFRKTRSITIPVQLPSTGGGVRYWNPALTVAANSDPKTLGVYCDYPYAAGKLYYFSGHFLHQIAPNPKAIDDLPRMTLQAHSIWHQDGYWLVYW
jgi:hypothetical protein